MMLTLLGWNSTFENYRVQVNFVRAVDAFGTMFRTNLSIYIFYVQELAAFLPFMHQCKVYAELNQTVLSFR